MITTLIKSHHRLILALFVICVLATSCSKKDNPQPEPLPSERPEGMVPYYKLQRVENLHIEVDPSNPMEVVPDLYYSLNYKKVQPESLTKTADWDLAFGGARGSTIGGNNNTDPNNSGYKGAGKGGITIVDKAFDQVVDIPAEMDFKTGKGSIGTDDEGFFGQGLGWCLYDFNGNIVGDGSENKKHVACALGNSLKLKDGRTVTPRTIIVRTGNGDYAKIKIISCYQNIYDPSAMFTTSPSMYFTFEYVVVPADSKQFIIK